MEDWPVLQRFWERATTPGFRDDERDPIDRQREEARALNRLGIAVEPALRLLYRQRPDLPAFKGWLQEHSREPLRAGDVPHADVLTHDDLRFWHEHGYVVLRQAVDEVQCAAARAAIWEYLGADAADPASWYREHEGKRGMMLSLFDHPALMANRRAARIRNACRQLYGSDAIYHTIDKAGFNPPVRADAAFAGSGLHWDASLLPPVPLRLQGMLYLSDCGVRDGAFHCVPGFHRLLDDWLRALPPDANPRELAPRELQPVAVPAQAGDFVIWHQALPHCATPNHGALPRLVQYLTYLPDALEPRVPWH